MSGSWSWQEESEGHAAQRSLAQRALPLNGSSVISLNFKNFMPGQCVEVLRWLSRCLMTCTTDFRCHLGGFQNLSFLVFASQLLCLALAASVSCLVGTPVEAAVLTVKVRQTFMCLLCVMCLLLLFYACCVCGIPHQSYKGIPHPISHRNTSPHKPLSPKSISRPEASPETPLEA